MKELHDKILDSVNVKRSMPRNAWLWSLIESCQNQDDINLLFEVLHKLRRFVSTLKNAPLSNIKWLKDLPLQPGTADLVFSNCNDTDKWDLLAKYSKKFSKDRVKLRKTTFDVSMDFAAKRGTFDCSTEELSLNTLLKVWLCKH